MNSSGPMPGHPSRPARQRLEAGDPAAGQVDDRLEVDLEQLVLDRRAQLVLPAQAGHHPPVHALVEHRASGPGRPRLASYMAMSALRTSSAASMSRLAERDADAGGDEQLPPAERGTAPAARRCSRSATTPGLGLDRPGRRAGSVNSSPPTRATVSPGRSDSAQPLGERHQQLVADGVAEAVVDELEAVDVEEQHRAGELRVAPRARAAADPPGRRTAPGWAAR